MTTKPSKSFDINRQLVYNAVRCLSCNEVLVSYYGHDYKTCSCDNQTMVDGGNNYQRYGGKDLNLVETIAYFDDDPYEVVRTVATRGTRGKEMNEPLKWITLDKLTDNHLQAIVDYYALHQGDKVLNPREKNWHLKLIHKEIEYRKENNISIPEND